MNAIDLYQLTRVNDINIFTAFENNLSARQKIMKSHEKDSLTFLVTALITAGISAEGLRYFYHSYEIPQIGKEFDLLRINDEKILNIELKSQDVGIDRIEKQLTQNMQYLSHFTREMMLFTFVSSTKKFYRLNVDKSAEECSVNLIISVIHEQINCFAADINSLFRVSDFLVSPLNTPEKFIQKKYFLTPQQQNNKNSILLNIEKYNNCSLFCGITGGPGTGKTLALYDLAHLCSSLGQVCMIHCGILSGGHNQLNKLIPNLDVYSARSFDDIDFNKYKYIFIDESHRFYSNQLNTLISAALNNKPICIFSYDKRQILSHKETNRNIVEKIQEISGFQEYNLSNKIRTNKEIGSFIRRLFDLNHTDVQPYYPSISVLYANNEEEATFFIEEYRKQAFVFINYTQSQYKKGSFDNYIADTDTHHVIGQEFNNILMLIDNTFHYNNKGKLVAKTHPNPDYLYTKLLFQGLTRVREKLAVIVLKNPAIFSNILSILCKQVD